MVSTVSVHAVTGFSEINNELFDKAHLKNISIPGVLHYEYKKESFIDGAREDTIDMTITNVRNTGRKDTSFEFFTGAHNRPYQDRDNQQGNGVFVLYLEFDIRELDRLTGGDWAYFQRKIRWALAKGAVKKEIEFEHQGQLVKGIQYIIQPFFNDPKKERYSLYANKYYIFTMSEEIPGEIYQIRTIVPDGKKWQEGDEVLTEETLTFVGFEAK
ncbi:hypothetical protein A9Q79_00625 [Methylophaga sp. 42_25_T18]|nr:hypothetical protein A9Q79_00625 [Methylophaga sp. 42_25_T18]OUR86089.1 hypothetical protein A9Q92_06565 [Methylophaga sp. 42_8_T64]